jgi:hypothetical protein
MRKVEVKTKTIETKEEVQEEKIESKEVHLEEGHGRVKVWIGGTMGIYIFPDKLYLATEWLKFQGINKVEIGSQCADEGEPYNQVIKL